MFVFYTVYDLGGILGFGAGAAGWHYKDDSGFHLPWTTMLRDRHQTWSDQICSLSVFLNHRLAAHTCCGGVSQPGHRETHRRTGQEQAAILLDN